MLIKALYFLQHQSYKMRNQKNKIYHIWNKDIIFCKQSFMFAHSVGNKINKSCIIFCWVLIIYYSIITMEEIDSCNTEAINQLKSSKKQASKNAVYNLLSLKWKISAILYDWNSVHISDIFNCCSTNINKMWYARKLDRIYKTFKFVLS